MYNLSISIIKRHPLINTIKPLLQTLMPTENTLKILFCPLHLSYKQMHKVFNITEINSSKDNNDLASKVLISESFSKHLYIPWKKALSQTIQITDHMIQTNDQLHSLERDCIRSILYKKTRGHLFTIILQIDTRASQVNKS